MLIEIFIRDSYWLEGQLGKIRAYGTTKRLVRSKEEPHSEVLVSSMFLHYYVHYRVFFLVEIRTNVLTSQTMRIFELRGDDL